jgi:hypothetical protein
MLREAVKNLDAGLIARALKATGGNKTVGRSPPSDRLQEPPGEDGVTAHRVSIGILGKKSGNIPVPVLRMT